jgi:hypothetical protein
MRKIKQVLRLKWVHNLSNGPIAKSCSIFHSSVREYLLRAEPPGLSWPLDPEIDNVFVEMLLFPAMQKHERPSAFGLNQ